MKIMFCFVFFFCPIQQSFHLLSVSTPVDFWFYNVAAVFKTRDHKFFEEFESLPNMLYCSVSFCGYLLFWGSGSRGKYLCRLQRHGLWWGMDKLASHVGPAQILPLTATSLGPVPSLAVLDCPDEAVCPTPRLGVPCRGGVPAGPSPPAALRPAAFTAHTHASPSHQPSLTDSEIKLLRIQDSDRITLNQT